MHLAVPAALAVLAAALGFGFGFVALTWPLLWTALVLIAGIVFALSGGD